MSSIFTFDPDAQETLSSPWPLLVGEVHPPVSTNPKENVGKDHTPSATLLADYGIDSLDPEPQDGPTEYKLHLLLRPRRSFAALSTVQRVSGSHLPRSRLARLSNGGSPSVPKSPATSASSTQSRESRLQNLTTQLLWRLQQSSPHHSASRAELVVPVLPGALAPPFEHRLPGKLIPGLGDSQGALYEIGVADDGTLVGLTVDELDESLSVLRAMAYSLGCDVRILRRIIVGDCQWLEDVAVAAKVEQRLRMEKVWVAEAFVFPARAADDSKTLIAEGSTDNGVSSSAKSHLVTCEATEKTSRTDQLRVSLTGSTTSGKSSLLGTLSTSTLDNGRGKSRLSLLKHRHEIASGVTSSVTGSLIGYHDLESSGKGDMLHYQVINYASGNISSWTDIHSATDPGRLVYLNDSAGHPKFRRTTVRGLVSWAPHWTICCVAADQEGDTTGRAGATASATDILGTSCAEMDLAKAHLELCLRLGLPLIVLITKLDLASLNALKPMLGRILSLLKSAGRRPEILSAPSDEQRNMQSVDGNDELQVRKLLSTVPQGDECEIVPIVLTSAVTGKGVGKLHALLRLLPIPRSPEIAQPDEVFSPSTLFHIDEIFAASDTHRNLRQGSIEVSFDSILCGCLRHGSLNIGQEVIIGPFSTSISEDDLSNHEVHRANSYSRIKGSPKACNSRRALPRPLSGGFPVTIRSNNDYAQPSAIWRRICVSSIRNLRLPVNRLRSDQVGTVGLSLSSSTTVPATSIARHSDRAMDDGVIPPLTSQDRIRKGMVLMSYPDRLMMNCLRAYDGFVALMEPTESLALQAGESMIAYIASIRSPVRITDWRNLPQDPKSTLGMGTPNSGDREDVCKSGATAGEKYKITCEFSTTQEWFEIGSRVLVMPASGFGLSNPGNDKGEKLSIGLEGFVGRIVQGLG
ncbi:MAG: hypothetical protein LQ337_001304 [Flavoplaca oasis]|nr:MAG: hypothetical protein LQ337_001304 [Flavoplaca oasis]